MPRERMEKKEEKNFFAHPNEDLEFFSSGCRLLDRVIGGGWVLGRVGNIVGDESTGKTLLAIEASANFNKTFPDGFIGYREAEAAFDTSYAEILGMPIDAVDFGKKAFDTVEDFYDDLSDTLKLLRKSKDPGLYIVDSLDALSDDAEMKHDMAGEKNLQPATKARKLGELFRQLVRDIESTRCSLLIISQVRTNIGVTFGTKKYRTGGRALDFYASQIIWLAKIKTLMRQYEKVERATGVQIKARCSKNKVGLPFRECLFDVMFGYGIDDVGACIAWLNDVGRGNLIKGLKPSHFDSLHGEDMVTAREDLNRAVDQAWGEIETSFLPKRRKYE